MPRTSVNEVKNIISTNLSDEVINSYIDSASTLVDYSLGGKLDDSLLTQIEKWLAAHFIATTRQRQLKSGKAGPASAEYFGKDGAGLKSSTYGQQAIALDLTGTLDRLSEGRPKTKMESL